MRPFLAVWGVAFAIALVASGFALANIVHRILAPVTNPQAMGFTVATRGRYPTIGTVVRSVQTTGLAKGDLVLTVNGRPAEPNPIGFARQLALPDGAHATLRVRSPAGQVRDIVLVHDERPFRRELLTSRLTPNMVVFGIGGIRFLFGEMLFLAAAAALMWNRMRDPLAPWASAMMVLLALGNGAAGEWLASQVLGDLRWFDLLDAAGSSALAVILAVFPTGRFRPRWSIGAAAIGIAVPIMSEGLSPETTGLLVSLTWALGVATIVARYRRMPAGTARQQIRWALLSIGASVAALLLAAFCQFADRYATAIGPDLWFRIGAGVFSSLTHALIVIGIAVALLRYRLYDADAAISRSVAYTALTLGIVATFSVSQKLIEMAESRYFGAELGPMAGTLGGVLAAAAIAPLRKRTSAWAERRFRGNLTSLTAELPVLLDELREVATPQTLSQATLDRIARGVRATRGAVVAGADIVAATGITLPEIAAWALAHPLGDGGADLATDRDDAIFPARIRLRSRGGVAAGWLLLGPRPDGSLYGREEERTFAALSSPIGSALTIAGERERRHRRQFARLDQMQATLDAIFHGRSSSSRRPANSNEANEASANHSGMEE